MLPAPFRVVVDACALCWSAEILEEMRRNLVAKLGLSDEHAAYRCRTMHAHFPEALVTGYAPYVFAMANAPKDRHVAAAALKAGAQVIVTFNVRDFKQLPEGIEAQTPDTFLCNLLDLRPAKMLALLEAQAAALQRPPITFYRLLGGLATIVPEFAATVAAYADRGHN
jgi:hypothetical protein